MRKKWLFILTAIILSLAVVVLTRDFWVKKAIIKGLQSAADAKVDIEDLHVSLNPFGITIKKLEIANQNSPMRNLVEIDTIQLLVEPLPALEKKWIVDDVRVTGISINTPRKTSGYIPVPPPPKEENVYKKDLKQGLANEIAFLKAQLPALQLPKTETLEVVKTFNASKTQADAMGKKWEAVFAGKTIQSDLDKINALTESLSKTSLSINKIEDLNALKKTVTQVQDLLNQTQNLSKKVQTIQTDFNTDMKTLSGIPQKLQQAGKNDIQTLKQPFSTDKLKSIDFKNGIVFEPLKKRLDPVFKKIELALKFKETLSIPKPQLFGRDKGQFVQFEKETHYPKFWVKHVAISGNGKQGELVQGQLTDLTSDQRLIGKPLVVSVSAIRLLNSAFGFQFNFTQTPFNATLKNQWNLAFTHFPLQQFIPLPKKEFMVTQADLSFTHEATLINKHLDGAVKIAVDPLKVLSQPVSESNLLDLNAVLGDVLAGISSVQAGISISGVLPKPDIAFQTNIDSVFQNAFQTALQKRLDYATARVQQQIDTLVKEKEKEANAWIAVQKKAGDEWIAAQNKQLDALKKSLEAQQKALEKAANGQLDQAKAQVQAGLDSAKKEAEQKADAAKKEAEKKANEELEKAKQKAIDDVKKSLKLW